jgi:hypothetical protein
VPAAFHSNRVTTRPRRTAIVARHGKGVDRMNEYVTVERAGNEAMADLIKQRLDEAGIPSVIAPSNIVSVAGAGATFFVSVPPERADEARELLGNG